MNFLDKNGFRAAMVIAVIFLAMPFMFPERIPISDKNKAEESSQPVKSKKFLTGVYDRIGNFYGFKKSTKSTLDQALEQLKKEADGAAADNKAAQDDAKKSFDKAASAADASAAGADAGGGSFDTGTASSKMSFSAAAAKASAKPKLLMGGKEYEVVKDLYDNDYAITGKGPVAVSSLLAKGGVLKYPSGKTVSGARVSSEAYNAGGGANPYASLTASSKASSGSYKGGKRSGGVASARKIASGFSLRGSGGGAGKSSRKGAGARGYTGDFTGAVDIEDAYNKVQAQAVAVKSMQQAVAFENQLDYYDAALPASSRTAAPAIAPALLQGDSMFEGGIPASVAAKDVNKANDTKTDAKAGKVDINEIESTEVTDTKPEANADPTKVTVDINLNGGTGIIPKDTNVLQNMTNKLLGSNIDFKSTPTAGKKDGIKNPWIFPTVIPVNKENKKEFSLAFWKANKDALANAKKDAEGNLYSDPETWKKSDESNETVLKNIKTQNIPVAVIVSDGVGTGSQRNYFQQMGNYITGNTPKAQEVKKIYVVKNEKEKDTLDKDTYVFVFPMTITPEDIKNFGSGIQGQLKSMEQKAAEKAQQTTLALQNYNKSVPPL